MWRSGSLKDYYCRNLIAKWFHIFEFEAFYDFYVVVFKCKWASARDTFEAEPSADSKIRSILENSEDKSALLFFTILYFSSIDCLAKYHADEKRKTNGKTSAYTTLTCMTHVFFRMHDQYGEILPKVAFLFLFFCIFTR